MVLENFLRFLITLFATLLLLGLAECNEARAQASLRVSPEAEVYDHLEHFRALGLWRGSLELRPMSRRALAAAVDKVADHRMELAAGDLRRLDRMLAIRQAWDLPRAGARVEEALRRELGAPSVLWELGAALRYQGGPSDLDSLTLIDRRPHRKGFIHLSLNAEMADRLGAQIAFYEDYSRLTRSAAGGGWVDNLPVDAAGITQDPSARLSRAVLAYSLDWMELRFGREERRWGAGRHGSLFLSENPFPLDGFSFHFNTRYVSGATLFAQTRRGSQPPTAADEDLSPQDLVPGDAYVAMHRFELRPPGPASFGLWEAAAYGGRGIDLAYANPVALLVAVTQDIWDNSHTDDKKVVGADFRLDLPSLTLYGEFLLDRLVTLDMASEGEESGISSFAQLLGLRWANPFGARGADLDVEYAHLDPQVYFHHDGDPRRALMREDRLGEGALLGHWLGPNADSFHAALRLPPGSWGRISLEYERARWGLVNGMRGDEIGFHQLQKRDKDWITGVVASEHLFRLGWERRDWDLPLGRLDTRLSVARVDRPWQPPAVAAEGGGPPPVFFDDDGWQAELLLNWRFAHILRED